MKVNNSSMKSNELPLKLKVFYWDCMILQWNWMKINVNILLFNVSLMLSQTFPPMFPSEFPRKSPSTSQKGQNAYKQSFDHRSGSTGAVGWILTLLGPAKQTPPVFFDLFRATCTKMVERCDIKRNILSVMLSKAFGWDSLQPQRLRP